MNVKDFALYRRVMCMCMFNYLCSLCRAGAASAVLLGDKMVVAGGWDGSQLLDSVELGAGHSDWATVPGWT